MQGVAAKNDASYDLSGARASVTGPTTIAASPATPSLPNGRIVTRRRPAPTQWRSVKSCPTSPSNPSAAAGTPSFWLPSRSRHCPPRQVRQMWSIGFSICPPSGRPSVDSGGRPDRPACSSRSLEPARSRSRRGLPPGGQLYPGSRAHPARRARLRAPSNNRAQLRGRGHRFVEGLAPPAVLGHVLAI